MFFIRMLGWWYGGGWLHQTSQAFRRIGNIARAFSGGTLLKTLFRPWKQITFGGGPNASLQMRMRAVLDNIVSRFVGFMMRSATLFAALVSIIFVSVISLIWVVVWPLLPLSPIVFAFIWLIEIAIKAFIGGGS